jgi:hypothetical protein
MANINKIKYYPDRFYIGLDGFDLTKLFEVSPDYIHCHFNKPSLYMSIFTT